MATKELIAYSPCMHCCIFRSMAQEKPNGDLQLERSRCLLAARSKKRCHRLAADNIFGSLELIWNFAIWMLPIVGCIRNLDDGSSMGRGSSSCAETVEKLTKEIEIRDVLKIFKRVLNRTLVSLSRLALQEFKTKMYSPGNKKKQRRVMISISCRLMNRLDFFSSWLCDWVYCYWTIGSQWNQLRLSLIDRICIGT